ncbi:FAD-dependent oxidoreductase [Glaciimonas sp. Gout2]|uniref:NAD(P)/FAD-dependent oxidoreductase n=1 Tax=unclassified Glaciimonas TaxID=2644401 RepID=UPI002B223DC7|nr:MULTISPECIES: FAD-dependent oxidoreductase [unclassified Glaciimonas]MEB0014100.1 FAD-dependent oxidoreductase [Glaciimonas sp. Cout2]MEB0083432.1 FAD-dependent oxidoreductase [Glaciimonas sp. Gout2]
MKIAIIGSGISGLSCAYRLTQAGHHVSLYEANDYFGGHTNTVDVTLEGQTYGVDTGFLVFNHRTYPNLVNLFDELQVETVATDMSFSVKIPINGCLGKRTLEWSGTNLNSVFTQRRNLLNPRYIGMIRDILRFNKQATLLANDKNSPLGRMSLGEFLSHNNYSQAFKTWYLLPMAGCIWSCPTAQMLAFPVSSFIRFCHNHGLLQVNDRPQWHTVKGGARQYVEKIIAAIPHKYLKTPVTGVRRAYINDVCQVVIQTHQGSCTYDHVVMAGHSDQSLKLLQDISMQEKKLLSAVQYQPNHAVLHTDHSLLPGNRKAWAAWNYQSENGNDPKVCVHYLLNQLQPLPFKTPLIVSLNPIEQPAPHSVIRRFDYAHPIFDATAIAAQPKFEKLQGQNNTWFAGAWLGYGFHEDGLKSGLAVANAIIVQPEITRNIKPALSMPIESIAA